jgi:stage II sporulation protein D
VAGDAHLPRLLNASVRVAVLVLVAACGSTACQAPYDTRDRQPVPAGARSTPESRPPQTLVRPDDDSAHTALDRVAWARVRWPEGDVLDGHLAARLEEPVRPGSLFKLVVARAAGVQGLVTPETRIVCPRQVVVHGRRVDCVHPDLGRPLTLDDALAHSCNHFFVRLAERLDRAGLATTLRRLSAGAVTLRGEAPLPLVVLGLEGPQASLQVWMRVSLAAMADDGADEVGSRLVRRGVQRAAIEGTAAALADETTQTLAKTGTTLPDGAAQEGLLVAWRPERGEAVMVRAPGVAGRDAARIAAAAWERADAHDGPAVRVGRVRETVAGTAVARVDELPLESYVAGVVAAEGTADLPDAALDALAIAARSYATAPERRHARDGYDVCDTTHCQVLGPATPWSRAAMRRTRGVVLARGGHTVAVPYSASCSGVLSSPRDLWGGAAPDITRIGRDPNEHEVRAWRSDVDAEALHAALRDAGHRGDVLRDVRIAARTREGLPARVALEGLTPADIDATTFRHVVGRRLGWDVVKSHAWDVTRTGRGYRFSGRGIGHGVGLCVRGAAVQAARGASTTQILATYVPGAALRASGDRITLRVPSALTAEAPRLRADVQAMLADLRLTLAVTAPRDVVVEVHPTVQAYQRATGRAGWTAGSTRVGADGRSRIDLSPGPGARLTPETLRPTLRHELVHVLTAPVLVAAPAWMTEGLAAAIGRPMLPGEARGEGPAGPCPSDQEVQRPGSLDAMQGSYARAAACVIDALPAGLSTWRTLAWR